MTARTSAPALGVRDTYIASIAEERGYEMTRVTNGYRLKRDGRSKIYQTATGCLTALMTGDNLPTKRAAVAPVPAPPPVPLPVPAPIPDPVPEPTPPPNPLAGHTLTPGDGGVWLARGGRCMWFASEERARWAVTTGNMPELMRGQRG